MTILCSGLMIASFVALGPRESHGSFTSEAALVERSFHESSGVAASSLDGLGVVQLEKTLDQVAADSSQKAFDDAMLNFALLQAQSGVVSEEEAKSSAQSGSREALPAHADAAGGLSPTSASSAASTGRSFGDALPESERQAAPKVEEALLMQRSRGHMGVKQAIPDHERSAMASQSLSAAEPTASASGAAKGEIAAVASNGTSRKVTLGEVTRLAKKGDTQSATVSMPKVVGLAHDPDVAVGGQPQLPLHNGTKQDANVTKPAPQLRAAAAADRGVATKAPLAHDVHTEAPLAVVAPTTKPGLAAAKSLPNIATDAARPPLAKAAAAGGLLPQIEHHETQKAQVDEVAAILNSEQGGLASLMKTRNRFAVCLLVVIAVVSIFGNACFAAGMCLSTALWKRNKLSPMRRRVESLPVCTLSEIDKLVPSAGGYDCTFSKPLSSKMLLRLEARVQRPTGGSQLMAPLTKKTCVLYSSAVSRKLHDGMTPVPVAFSFASVNFTVSLLDAPHIAIEVKGADVTLFDMREGRHVERRSFNRVPDDWQDFISSHRTSPHLSSTLRLDDAVLEFQECTLCVGAVVTMVGELHRNANGVLSLRPWSGQDQAARPGPPRERWRTSWEDWSCVSASAVAHDAANALADNYVGSTEEAATDSAGDLENASDSTESEVDIPLEKVLMSDNPELYRTDASASCCGGTLCCGSFPRRWRCCSCGPARSLLGKEKGGQ